MAEGNKQSPFNSTNEEHLGPQQSVSSNNNAQDKKKKKCIPESEGQWSADQFDITLAGVSPHLSL